MEAKSGNETQEEPEAQCRIRDAAVLNVEDAHGLPKAGFVFSSHTFQVDGRHCFDAAYRATQERHSLALTPAMCN